MGLKGEEYNKRREKGVPMLPELPPNQRLDPQCHRGSLIQIDDKNKPCVSVCLRRLELFDLDPAPV